MIRTLGICLIWVFLFDIASGQSATSERNLVMKMKDATLMIVYPTYSVKHQRMREIMDADPDNASLQSRVQAQIKRECAERDTLIVALAQSFAERFPILPVRLVPDTAWVMWRNGADAIPTLDTELNFHLSPVEPARMIWLRNFASETASHTGQSRWRAVFADNTSLHPYARQSFSEMSILRSGSRFISSFFSSGKSIMTLAERKGETDYLAAKINQHWTHLFKKWE